MMKTVLRQREMLSTMTKTTIIIMTLIGENFKIIYLILAIIAFVTSGCKIKHNQFDYEYYSERYCDCYSNHLNNIGSERASFLCDSIMSSENRYFNAFKSNIEVDTFYKTNSKELEDSTNRFMSMFIYRISKKCPGTVFSK